jgi:radical SAM-linked protein
LERDAGGRLGVDSAKIAQSPQELRSLQERLDAEVLPRLERPGRCLGPFVRRQAASGKDEIETIAIWRLQPGASVHGSTRDDLTARLSQASPSPIAWLSPPSPSLVSELRTRHLPLFTRPGRRPLASHPVQLIVIDDFLEVFDLYAVLSLMDQVTPRPTMVACGAAVQALRWVLGEVADWIVPTEDIEALATELSAGLSRGPSSAAEVDSDVARDVSSNAASDVASDVARLLRDFAGRRDLDLSEGSPNPSLWPAWPGVESAANPRGHHGPAPLPDFVCGRAELESAGARDCPLGEGGRRLEAHLHTASAARRAALGIRWKLRDSELLSEALADEFVPLRLHLSVGLPGDDGEDLASALRLLRDLRVAAGAERRIEVQLHCYFEASQEEAASPTWIREWADTLRSATRESKIRVAEPRPELPWILACVHRSGEGGPALLRRVFALGATSSQSGLATDIDLWHKSMQQADLCPPAVAHRAATSFDEARAGAAVHGLDDALCLPELEGPAAKGESATNGGDLQSQRWQKWKALVPRRFDTRIVYRNRGLMRFLSQGELGAIVARRCRECDLPLATTGRVQPKLRMSFGPWLAVGIEGTQEYLDLSFRKKIADLRERLAEGLPEGFELLAAQSIPLGQPQLALSRVALAEYEVSLGLSGQNGSDALHPFELELSQRLENLRERKSQGEETTPSDLHHQLHDVHLSTDGIAAACLAFTLDLRDPGQKRKPHDFLGLLLGDLVEDVRTLPIRRTRLFVRDESRGAPHWRTPLEMLESATRGIRKAEKTCA